MKEPVDYPCSEPDGPSGGAQNEPSTNGEANLHWADHEPLMGRVTGELPSWEASVVDAESPERPTPTPILEQPSYGSKTQPASGQAMPPVRPPVEQPHRQAQAAPRPQPQPQPRPQHRPQNDDQYFDRQPPTQQQPPTQRSSSKLGWIVAGIVALLAAGLGGFALTQRAGGATDSAQGQISASPVGNPVDDISLLLQGIGYDGIDVELKDNALFLSGDVDTQADLAAVITASSSLAEGLPINTDGLTITPAAGGAVTVDTGGEAEPIASDPLRKLQVALDRTVAVAPVIFAPTVTDVEDWHTSTLDQVAGILLDNPGIAVSIVGFTDESGRAENNAAISYQRAESVRNYLIDQGVSAGLLEIDPRGEAEASGLRDIGYLERRVEFDVVAADEIPTASLRPLDVGIIVPSPGDDLAFSQAMVDAIELLNGERGGLTTTVNDNMFDVDAANEMARQQAADGFDVVILHGTQFRPLVDDLAAEFSDTVFVTGPIDEDAQLPANVFAYSVAAEQGAYVLGDIAGQISQSATVGIVGPIEAAEPKAFVDGFAAGARAQGANVVSDYVGSFNDVDAARTLASVHVDAGADVLTGTAQLVTGPIELALERGLPWFANQANQTELAPDNVVASQVYHFEVALREILAELDAGATTGGNFPLTLGNGGLLLEFNSGYPLDSALRQQADELLFAVTAGSLTIDIDG